MFKLPFKEEVSPDNLDFLQWPMSALLNESKMYIQAFYFLLRLAFTMETLTKGLPKPFNSTCSGLLITFAYELWTTTLQTGQDKMSNVFVETVSLNGQEVTN